MNNLMVLILSTSVLCLILCAFMLVRNKCVLKVQLAFINRPGYWPDRYERLPEYGDMLFLPKYWLLWTPDHWDAWVNRQA